MTGLRKMMLEELQRRNYSEITTRKYLQYVTAFARHFGKSRISSGRMSCEVIKHICSKSAK